MTGPPSAEEPLRRTPPRRALMVVDFKLLPVANGNAARAAGVVRALENRGFEVHYLYLGYEDGSSEMRQAFGDRLTTINFTRHQSFPYRVALNLQSLLVKNERFFTSNGYLSRRVLTEISRRVSFADYAVVWLNYFHLSRLFTLVPRPVRRVLDTHDRFSDRRRRLASAGTVDHWLDTSARVERICLDRADVIVAIQAEERDYFRSVCRKPVVDLGHAITVAGIDALAATRPRHALIVGGGFVGNKLGLHWFIQEVAPLVLARCPDFRLLVVGRLVEHAPDVDWIERIGHAADLAPLYGRMRAALNPYWGGTGLSIKAIEGLANGVPVILRPNVAGALLPGGGGATPVLVGETAQSFADLLTAILHDDDYSHRLRVAAIAFARAYQVRQDAQFAEILGTSSRQAVDAKGSLSPIR